MARFVITCLVGAAAANERFGGGPPELSWYHQLVRDSECDEGQHLEGFPWFDGSSDFRQAFEAVRLAEGPDEEISPNEVESEREATLHALASSRLALSTRYVK